MARLRAHRLIVARFVSGAAEALETAGAWLRAQPGIVSIHAGEAGQSTDSLAFDFGGSDAELSQLLAGLVGRGLPVLSFGEERGDLEDVFLHVTQGMAD